MPSDFTPNNVWSSSPILGSEQELTLPSGQTCRAKQLGIEDVIATGLVEEVDLLTAAVDKHIRKVKGGKGVSDGPEIQNSLLKDREALKAIIGCADRMVPHIVMSPKVVLHYTEQTVGETKVTKMIPVEDRNNTHVYTDQIDLEDKMFLFNWSMGGIEAFASFRRESDSNVGDLANREGRRRKAKRSSRDR